MEIDKKYTLLDTDFLYKSYLARNANNHTLIDFVIEFSEYEFFCHEMIKYLEIFFNNLVLGIYYELKNRCINIVDVLE